MARPAASWPRHAHRNFYWLQEDWVRAQLAPRDIAFTKLADATTGVRAIIMY